MSTPAIVPPAIGTVFPVTVSPSIWVRFIAFGGSAVSDLFPVIATVLGRNAPVPVAIFSPFPTTMLLLNVWLEIGAFGTIEYATRA
ncbi:MAG: hypothetical protein DMD33_19925 [Gemmatimonadetes bacterium]|nr:MAG: hypothetical protein DMD33_19925 [Gemmatimonadota bacterium]